jgi:hypothetical protein
MNNLTPLHSALISIVNNEPEHFFFQGEPSYENLVWTSKTKIKPTEGEIADKILELEVEQKRTEHQMKRKSEYPSIGDQLDALFHAGVFPPEMAEQIQAVKDKYPKLNTKTI